ncbi:beta-ribofuranosylaminobenzene 5'-phosphate synthase family protein [Aurantimonas sp. HBX-1]|uniref:beta-ribofuranosylaminobenzene 5'-phosphate synthase family protein n=1 Tax=Aurantimonas sp. HBX-1 TaxID=2906072 RepID=UPI001F2B5B1E|nr:beta-ribofuranosylaminobenzene 5'-phosphate synthase family protein [Aurantimonas sp. HBX-1]UIJ72276.1 GHMP kinase [Aurantimonas sp. HBX-1]
MTEDVVSVSAPARLHLGFLDPGGRSGRRFGGIGLALAEPATRLSIRRASEDRADGPESARALAHLAAMRGHLGLGDRRYELTFHETIPPHAGLGSGTQLALAVATGLRAIEGLAPDPAGDAARLGRGNRSGLGAAFVSAGGVAVDGGKGPTDAPPPIIARLPFPEAWRVLLVLDPRTEGFHGEDELKAFASLPPFAEIDTALICRLVLLEALPALAEEDIAGFGAAIATIQQMVGSHFAPAQGGIFTSPAVSRICGMLAAAGAHGIGQSSWGPTGFAFAPSPEEADRLARAVSGAVADAGLTLRVVAGRNAGSRIERSPLRRVAGAG